jgi:hypothetical protein
MKFAVNLILGILDMSPYITRTSGIFSSVLKIELLVYCKKLIFDFFFNR